MSYLRDTAIVLKQTPYREYDARVVLFGRTYGKMTAVARGLKRPHAKHTGSLEPFSEIEVLIAKGKAFDKLAVARIAKPRLRLRDRLASLAIAGTFVDLAERLTRPDAPDVALYALLGELLDALDALSQEPSAARGRLMLNAATLKLLDLSGYALHLDQCIACRTDLAGTVSYAAAAGGFLCEICCRDRRREYPHALRLPEHALGLLRFLRLRPLASVLNVTASPELFLSAGAAIEDALRHAPLDREPHGAQTVMRILA